MLTSPLLVCHFPTKGPTLPAYWHFCSQGPLSPKMIKKMYFQNISYAGCVTNTGNLSCRLTCEPNKSIVSVCFIRNTFYCPHQAVHLLQASSVDFVVICCSSTDWRCQGNVHVSKCNVEKIWLSSCSAKPCSTQSTA